MQIASGKVVGGPVELESELPEGAAVTVLAHEGDETFEADEETERRLLETPFEKSSSALRLSSLFNQGLAHGLGTRPCLESAACTSHGFAATSITVS